MEWLTPKQVAELLQLNEQTVRTLLNNGKMKGSKVGKLWRVNRADILTPADK